MSYLEKLLEGVEVEWKSLGDFATYEQENISWFMTTHLTCINLQTRHHPKKLDRSLKNKWSIWNTNVILQ